MKKILNLTPPFSEKRSLGGNGGWRLPAPILRAIFLCFPFALAAAPGDLQWSFPTGDIVYSSPAIDDNGRVYFGSEDGILYAVNPDGTLAWEFTSSADWIDSSPAIGPDGTLYVGSWDNNLYAINPQDGSQKWSYSTEGLIMGSPAVDSDGNVYFGSSDGVFYSLNSSGDLRWLSLADGPVEASAAVHGGTVFFGDTTGMFYALDAANGSTRWDKSFPDNTNEETGDYGDAGIYSSPAIGISGNVYVGSKFGALYCFSPDGEELWSYKAEEAIDSSPAIGPDGTVYFASRDGYLYAVDMRGIPLWEVLIGDVYYASPAVDAEGNVVIGAYAGSSENSVTGTRLVSVSPDGQLNWSSLVPDLNDSSPAIARDGSIYFGSHDGNLYKVEGNASLADAPWPKFQANLENTAFAPGGFPDAGPLGEYFPAISRNSGVWWLVDWFGDGWVYGDKFPWVYHLNHSWIYLSGSGGENVWFNDGPLGWLYTSPGRPNYYWSIENGTWLFHLPGTSRSEGGRWFYDYTAESWVIQ